MTPPNTLNLQTNGLPPRYLRTPEAARFLGLSPRTLEKHRTYGTGPRYLKLGGRVVYTLEDLQAWAARGLKSSTSDPGVGTVLPAKRHAAIAPSYSKKPRP
jgi:predicted DNA-binding transcriptional regulator AlpA